MNAKEIDNIFLLENLLISNFELSISKCDDKELYDRVFELKQKVLESMK